MATRRSKARRPLGLYWVETDDHGRDWFIVAVSEHEAATSFEQAEAYEIGDAVATLVARVPAGTEAEPGWPSEEVLRACGTTVLRAEMPRVVELGERRFREGARSSGTDAERAARYERSAPAKKVHRPEPILPGEPRPLRLRRLQRKRAARARSLRG
jgi:hypothetical protein